MPDIDILGWQLLSILCVEFDLFSIELSRFALPKQQLVLIPVVQHEFLLLQFEHIFVVLNYEAWSDPMINDVRYFLVVKLQKIRKGLS